MSPERARDRVLLWVRHQRRSTEIGTGEAARQRRRCRDHTPLIRDDRVKIAQIIDTGGSATQTAATRALEGTEADQHAFIRTGQHITRQQDARVAAAQLLHMGGAEVQAAAAIALAGPPSYVSDFLKVGQFKAQRRDHDTATHVARVRGFVADAANIAATAQSNAAEAQRVAAIARNAATEADGYARQAKTSADQAGTYAGEAREHADDAQESANQAAASARVAREAQVSANRDARTAADAAAYAADSAAQAWGFAAEARASAEAAYASSMAANNDATLAAAAAAEAFSLSIDKQRQEDEARRTGSTTPDPDWPSGSTGQFDNGTTMLMLDGVCYLNGVELPRNLGTGSCVGLVHDFDIWLSWGAGNLNWDVLRGRQDAAEQFLREYCSDNAEACGSDLVRSLTDLNLPRLMLRIDENGVGSALGRLLGYAAKIPSLAKLAPKSSGWLPPAATSKIPAQWGPPVATKKGDGLRWFGTKPETQGVRIDDAVPGSPFPSQQVPHVIVRDGGKVIGRDGKPIKGSVKDDPVNAHIPLSEWLNWSFWNRP